MTKKADTTKAVDDYSSKATAKRGAKRKFGDDWEKRFYISQNAETGRFEILSIPTEPEAPKPPEKTKREIAHDLAFEIAKEGKYSGSDLCKAVVEACLAKGIGRSTATAQYQVVRDELNLEPEAPKAPKPPVEILRKSEIENPCQFVWSTADTMSAEGAKRKDIIDVCVKAGVAFYTARTQYQLWFKAKNAS